MSQTPLVDRYFPKPTCELCGGGGQLRRGLCSRCYQRRRRGSPAAASDAVCLGCDTDDRRVLRSARLGDQVVALCHNCAHVARHERHETVEALRAAVITPRPPRRRRRRPSSTRLPMAAAQEAS
jgi:hypothetical protein